MQRLKITKDTKVPQVLSAIQKLHVTPFEMGFLMRIINNTLRGGKYDQQQKLFYLSLKHQLNSSEGRALHELTKRGFLKIVKSQGEIRLFLTCFQIEK